MQPGIYLRGTCDYNSINAVNISSLLWMAKSPKHYKSRPRIYSSAMSLGTAAHAATLEPERFAIDFAVWDRLSENGNPCPRKGQHWEAFKQMHSRQEIITADEHASALAIAAGVRSEPLCLEALSNGDPEVTLVWVHTRTGLLCKGRVDWLPHDRNGIVDLKTAADITPGVFFSKSAKLHYHTKMAWYTDALRTVEGLAEDAPLDTLIVAVESGKPHDSAVYWMPEEVLEIGRDEYETLMTKLKLALDFDDWPGIANRARVRFELPRWAVDDPEDENDSELDWSKKHD